MISTIQKFDFLPPHHYTLLPPPRIGSNLYVREPDDDESIVKPQLRQRLPPPAEAVSALAHEPTAAGPFPESKDTTKEFPSFSDTPEEEEFEEDDDADGTTVDEEEEEDESYPPPAEDYVAGYGVDERDEGTADEWIKRHPELVRLTGRHPFNCEPPLHRLMEHGFLTPTSLHFVRNHGYVPNADMTEWRVEVSGLVRRPQVLRLEEIMNDFEAVEIPVTLVCAGNRRKEQNMTQQTIGFNWGPAGLSTSLWRGARLCDILKRCRIMYGDSNQNSKQNKKAAAAAYVCFEGHETLPGGGGSKYGTSISVHVAMQEACDVMVAYMQNGKPLEPDHGFPVRMIIPGYTGGRMVKWLRRIVVTATESDNYYHYRDNRLLPSHVDAEKANAEGWWYKPEYIINELNVNSAITTPRHHQILPINMETMQSTFTVKGYAYSGGGRKVTRVEVSVDGGEKWVLCRTRHPERPTKHGRYWCWCFWEVELEVLAQLLPAKELVVRAWESSMNTQPRDLTWNVMGMMNNCWFKVKISPHKPKHGGLGLLFEHPTQPGNQGGGWMGPNKKAPPTELHSSLTKSISSPMLEDGTEQESTTNGAAQLVNKKYLQSDVGSRSSLRQITKSELKRHNTRESAWIVVHDNVYDCTKFLKDHPGGSDSILINAGTDCTEEFDAIHSSKAKAMLEDFKIGEFVSFENMSSDSTPNNSVYGGMSSFSILNTLFPLNESTLANPVALNPSQKIKVKLSSKKILSHDVRLLRFDLPTKEHVLGLPTGKHIFLLATINGKLCMRAYTPVSTNDDVGYFELLIKVYFKGMHPQFPHGGQMSQYLDSIELGQILEVKGPLGHIEYNGDGHYIVEGKHFYMRKCGMIAGGTGITPMYQLIKAILNNPEDHTEIYLVFANKTESDIMLRDELDQWAREHPNFKVWYVVGRGTNHSSWAYSLGYVNEQISRENLPVASVETSIFMCGPPPMINFACLPNLDKLGHDKARCHQF